jgi:hypothetical protein
MRSDTKRSHQPEGSKDAQETGRDDENTIVTRQVTNRDLRVARLAAGGEPGNPQAGLTRRSYARKRSTTT